MRTAATLPKNSGNFAIARKADGNPEGKGANGFLLDWYQSEPRGVVAKPQRQLLAEFFTSMLVLSAIFKFRPVVGVSNYLYWINGEWSLLLPQLKNVIAGSQGLSA